MNSPVDHLFLVVQDYLPFLAIPVFLDPQEFHFDPAAHALLQVLCHHWRHGLQEALEAPVVQVLQARQTHRLLTWLLELQQLCLQGVQGGLVDLAVLAFLPFQGGLVVPFDLLCH